MPVVTTTKYICDICNEEIHRGEGYAQIRVRYRVFPEEHLAYGSQAEKDLLACNECFRRFTEGVRAMTGWLWQEVE